MVNLGRQGGLEKETDWESEKVRGTETSEVQGREGQPEQIRLTMSISPLIAQIFFPSETLSVQESH